jgi:hypothetical protein
MVAAVATKKLLQIGISFMFYVFNGYSLIKPLPYRASTLGRPSLDLIVYFFTVGFLGGLTKRLKELTKKTKNVKPNYFYGNNGR